MILEPITLRHHDAVEQIRKRYGHQTSSHAFLSLFLWKEEMSLQMCLTPNMFAVKCNRRGENCWFFPCGEPEAIKNFLHQQLDTVKAPLRLCYMRTEDAQMLNREFPNRFSLVATPDDDEYLYDREQQLLLQGKEFRHHRNSLNRLMKKYQIETIEITSENLEQAKMVLDRARENGMENIGILSTRSTERIILEHWDALNMNGVIVYAGGMPAAIAAGYFISDSMYDISVCRQAINDPDIAVYARHQLFSRLPQTIRLINAEEDLGLEGLRILKRGMRPVSLLTMFEGVSQ